MTPNPTLKLSMYNPPKPTVQQMALAMSVAWQAKFSQLAQPASIALLLSHQALETGWWAHMPCYNLGGLRVSSDEQTWTSFPTTEDLPPALAHEWAKASTVEAPCHIGPTQPSGHVRVICLPDHPASVFRAFRSLNEGIAAYLDVLYTRFSRVWPAILAGNPDQFVSALKMQGYFTADLVPYERTVDSIFASIMASKPTVLLQ